MITINNISRPFFLMGGTGLTLVREAYPVQGQTILQVLTPAVTGQ
jgi:hypothetical protein